MKLRPRQEKFVQKCFDRLHETGNALGIAPTGAGKCLGRGTPVLMHSGRIKKVEDIVVGDRLMGPDSKPRTVLSLARGREEMFRVTPTKGEPYTVNRSHILSLKMTGGCTSGGYKPGQIVNLSIDEYLDATNTFRHEAKGWRVGVEFIGPTITSDLLPPYLLGVWLGDGHSKLPSITTIDPEIISYLKAYAPMVGLKIRRDGINEITHHLTTGEAGRGHNHAMKALKTLNLIDNKHVPHSYKANTRNVRLDVLAGLIDTDGHFAANGSYDLIFKNEQLADDTVFLARSLGMAAYKKPCHKSCTNAVGNPNGLYYRVCISGHIDEIPVRIERKKAPQRRQIKDVLLTGIKVEPIGEGDYFGFEIDGDHLFLLGDFTVTHNTVMKAGVISSMLLGTTNLSDPKTASRRAIGRTLVLQHREELLRQNASKFLEFVASNDVTARVSIVDARRKDYSGDVIFAMVQTLASSSGGKPNYERLHGIDLISIDEAHHSPASSYTKIIEHLRKANPSLMVLGVTATPGRGDKKGYEGIFSGGPSDIISIEELIISGLLVPPRTFVIELGLDEELEAARKKKTPEEYDDKQVAAILDRNIVTAAVVREWKARAEDPWNGGMRKTLVFCSGVKHARHVAEAFREAGVSADYVDGGDPKRRRAVLAAFERGDIKVLCNVFVLTEGFDDQPTSCVVILRQSSNKSTYIQCVGRGLRIVNNKIYPGLTKKDCLVLDFGTSTKRHKSIEADISMFTKESSGEVPMKACPECWHPVHISVMVCPNCGYQFESRKKEKSGLEDFNMKEVDILGRSKFPWFTLSDDALLTSGFDAWAGVFQVGEDWHAVGAVKGGKVRDLAKGPKEWALFHADQFMHAEEESGAATKTARWTEDLASQSQLDMLKEMCVARGKDMPEGRLTKFEAAVWTQWRKQEHRVISHLLGIEGKPLPVPDHIRRLHAA